MRSRLSFLLLSVGLAALAAPSSALAGLNAWTVGSQSGGTPTRAVLSGNVGMVIVDRALFRTADGGATWSRATGFGDHQAVAVAIDPAAGQPWYAATGSGMFRSFDGGASWSEIAGAGDGRGFRYGDVAIDRGRAGVAFFVRGGGGVWRSENGGAGFWTDVSAGLGTHSNLDGIVVEPFTHVAWGWRYGGGVFTLADGQTTWTAVNGSLPSLDVIGVTIDPVSGRVLAGTTAGPATLTGGSTTWSPVSDGLTSTYALSISTDGAGVTFMATIDRKVWRLPSGGPSWERTSGWSPPGVTPRIVADATLGGHALALAANAFLWPVNGAGPVWRTTDSGLSWAVASGIAAPSIVAVAASPTVRGLVLATTTSDGVLRSTDGGASWTAVGAGVIPDGRLFGIAFDPASASTAFVGTSASGIFRSTDGGVTWSAYGAGGPGYATRILVDPLAPRTIWAGAGGGGLVHSTDGGLTWTPVGFAGINQQYFMPNAIAVDPSHPGGLYVAGNGGVFHLDPGASLWTAVGVGLGTLSVTDIAIDPKAPARMLVTAWNGGIYRSIDAGAHWAPAVPGLAEPFVGSIAFDAVGNAYAAAPTDVWRSADGGVTWGPIGGGLIVDGASGLAFDADGHTVYAATSSLGVVARSQGVAPGGGTPAVSGKAKVGSTLAVVVASGAFPAPTVTVVWQRCDAKGSRCKAIAGARGTSYKVAKADRGKRLRVTVTTTNQLGSTTRTSSLGAVVR